MTDCFIYDAARTPRGRGKADGSLHEVTALQLATQALEAVRDRNDLDTALVDDVVMGCVDPVGEAGGDIARAAALTAGYAQTVAGVHQGGGGGFLDHLGGGVGGDLAGAGADDVAPKPGDAVGVDPAQVARQ